MRWPDLLDMVASCPVRTTDNGKREYDRGTEGGAIETSTVNCGEDTRQKNLVHQDSMKTVVRKSTKGRNTEQCPAGMVSSVTGSSTFVWCADEEQERHAESGEPLCCDAKRAC